MLYSEKVLDHFTNPRNVGEIEDANAVGEVGNAKCGDIMKIYMKIQDNVIQDVKFKTFGCGAAVATSSMATEMIKGKSVDDALGLTNKAVMEALDGLPQNRQSSPLCLIIIPDRELIRSRLLAKSENAKHATKSIERLKAGADGFCTSFSCAKC